MVMPVVDHTTPLVFSYQEGTCWGGSDLAERRLHDYTNFNDVNIAQ